VSDKGMSFGVGDRVLNTHNKFREGNTDFSKLTSKPGGLETRVVKSREKIDALNEKLNRHDVIDDDFAPCECEACKNRRYKDISNDSGVSFKSAIKMKPKEAEYMVKSHENEHVRREQYKAKNEGNKVISQSVRIYTRNCKECGQHYVSGGETRTNTKYKVDGYYDALLNNTANLDKHRKFSFVT